MAFCRIDGTMLSAEERQAEVRRFQEPRATIPVFMLTSQVGGGVGVSALCGEGEGGGSHCDRLCHQEDLVCLGALANHAAKPIPRTVNSEPRPHACVYTSEPSPISPCMPIGQSLPHCSLSSPISPPSSLSPASAPQVGGLGLTLTAADRVIIVDPNWNPALDK